MWALHEDHRLLRSLCTAAADCISSSSSSSLVSDTVQASDSDLDRLSTLRYQFQKRGHLNEDEIQDLEDMLDRILVVETSRMYIFKKQKTKVWRA